MNEVSVRASLALHRNPQISDRQFFKLLASVDTPEQVFELGTEDLLRLELPGQMLAAINTELDTAQKRQLERDWSTLQSLQVTVISLGSDLYPALLKEIADPPALLYVRGNAGLLSTPQLAMVGSRRCSRQGAENALQFGRQLAASGFTITSGLALGIDAHSHQGALEVSGHTIAVLGTGVDIQYPKRNKVLFDRVAEAGALVSEFPLETGPRPGNFPVRNRIISGLSLGVLVVEGAPQSGSLVTARCAVEQGREVFAIPGSIHSPGSRGCHQLIRQGATLVETAGQIIGELGAWQPIECRQPRPDLPIELEPAEAALLALMGYDPLTIDHLQTRSNLGMAALSSLLMALELKGLVESQGGCYQRICMY